MSPTTAEAVALPPAPGPERITEPMKSPSTATALVTPEMRAMSQSRGTMVGCTRCSMPDSVRCATPSSFMR